METKVISVQSISAASLATDIQLQGPLEDQGLRTVWQAAAERKFDLCGKLKDPRISRDLRYIACGMSMPHPFAVDLDVSSACNFNCPSCVDRISLNRGVIPTERLRALINELVECGVQAVCFVGGGEPTTHVAMPECIEWARHRGLVTALVTNGSLLHKNIPAYADSVSSWLRVSVDAATARTHAAIHGVGEAWFPTIIKSLEALGKVKWARLGYSFVVFPDGPQANYLELAQAARLAREIGCDYFEAKVAVDPLTKQVLPASSKVRSAISEQLAAARELSGNGFEAGCPASFLGLVRDQMQHQVKVYPRCLAQELRTTVTPSGLYVCTYRRGENAWCYGSLNDASFQDLWRGERRRQLEDTLIPALHCPQYCCRHKQNEDLDELVRAGSDGTGGIRLARPVWEDDELFV